jgi:hypothetical protein
LAATTSCTVPLPDPLLPAEMLIQAALLDAFQLHPAGAVTDTEAGPPPLPTFWLAGEIEYEHPPSCVTVNVWPPAVIVPVRCGPGFAAAEKRTVPLPLPDAPPVTDSQFALLDADHPHPSVARTSNDPLPPPAGTEARFAESENVQPWPWLTVKVRPAIVSVPDRAGPLVAATLNATLPDPLPLAPELIVIHGTLLAAVQGQPAPAVTETVPPPPDAATFWVSGAMANVQPCDCTIVTARPAIVAVPVRAGPLVAAMDTVTDPDPLPLPPAVIVIHASLVEAVHAHPAALVTDTVRVPPPGSTVRLSGETS